MGNLGRFLATLRQVGGDDWRLRQIILFVRIAEAGKEGITLTELQDEFSIPQAGVKNSCKAMRYLSHENYETGTTKTKGLGLLEQRDDYFHTNRKNVYLSEKGLKIWEELIHNWK